jgi:hypothetical protein
MFVLTVRDFDVTLVSSGFARRLRSRAIALTLRAGPRFARFTNRSVYL